MDAVELLMLSPGGGAAGFEMKSQPVEVIGGDTTDVGVLRIARRPVGGDEDLER